jgi:hypothetical protein
MLITTPDGLGALREIKLKSHGFNTSKRAAEFRRPEWPHVCLNASESLMTLSCCRNGNRGRSGNSPLLLIVTILKRLAWV